jgi:hypothetical protein
MPSKATRFVTSFISEFLETRLANGMIDTDEYNDLVVALKADPRVPALSAKLFKKSPGVVRLPEYGSLRLIYLRELGGSTFPFLQGLSGRAPDRKKLTCFVGHRFLPAIAKDLRHNLAQLLGPYDVVLRWSGYDISAAGLFSGIVNGIASADMCFFDNLGTLNKPNVYIEIGIAHALGKPMIVTEYSGPARKNARSMPDTGSVPSDLQGLFRIQYRSYEGLCKELYFGLPMFFDRNRLRPS